jgi:hypothetical protein
VWDFRVSNFKAYIMGVYGAENTKGLDVIRLTGNGNYFNDPDDNFNYDVPLALPEVMGGGGTSTQPMPAFPYKNPERQEEWAWGCPDGHADGIILAFSSGGWRVTN